MPAPDAELHDKMIEIKEDAKAMAVQTAKLEDLYGQGVVPPPHMDPVTGDKCGGEVVDSYATYFMSLSKLAGIIKNECDVVANDPNLE